MSEMTNMVVDNNGNLRPRKSWKTFGGMVWQLYLINRRFKKLGVRGDFTVRLPLPDGRNTKFVASIKSDTIKFKS